MYGFFAHIRQACLCIIHMWIPKSISRLLTVVTIKDVDCWYQLFVVITHSDAHSIMWNTPVVMPSLMVVSYSTNGNIQIGNGCCPTYIWWEKNMEIYNCKLCFGQLGPLSSGLRCYSKEITCSWFHSTRFLRRTDFAVCSCWNCFCFGSEKYEEEKIEFLSLSIWPWMLVHQSFHSSIFSFINLFIHQSFHYY